MTESEKSAFAALADLTFHLQGTVQAMQVIQDVLVSSLLMHEPQKAVVLLQHLEQRLTHVPEMEGATLEMFQQHIDGFRTGLRVLGQQRN